RNSVFYAREKKLTLSTGLKLMKTDVDLYLPAAVYEELSAKLFNGSFELRDAEMKQLDIKTANGKIDVKRVKAEELEAETGNGQIYLVECDGRKVEASTVNGTVHVVGNVQEVDIKSFNGNVLCHAKNEDVRTIKSQAVTGNIELYVPETIGVKGRMRTNLGSLHLPVSGFRTIASKEEMVQKQIQFESEQQLDQTLHIDTETRSGSVFLKTYHSFDQEQEGTADVTKE
ncbi:MAG TPA: DUF4097 family beta strand repeat-containing protein, partial [Chondromyces sp.]|nr:DUF4097 family beta strand repeat-containing protein [Chondromyces sp.]